MWPLPCGDLFLCGAQSAEKLAKNQIRTIGQQVAADVRAVERILGKKAGRLLHDYANGIVTEEAARRVLGGLAEKLGRRLRKAGVLAHCVS